MWSRRCCARDGSACRCTVTRARSPPPSSANKLKRKCRNTFQAERTRAFNAFRDKECNLLVATDVAARGVDLPNVEHVINYTFPLTIEDYVHRIGRTGRGDSVGNSWTFFTTADKAHAGALVNVLQTAKQEVPQDMFQFSLATKRKGGPKLSCCAPAFCNTNADAVDATYGVFGPKDDLQGRTGTKITFDDSD